MFEADAVALSTRGPVTRRWLAGDLRALGVHAGMLLMVHASLSRLGWVIGGAPTVVAALRDVLGATGTLVMPAFTGGNSDPANWSNPPVPEDWKDTIRAELPAFDPLTPTREMGAVAEYFRTLPGVRRSTHPAASWAAQGPLAARIIDAAGLDGSAWRETPPGRCHDFDGWVLSLATRRTSVLHLADHIADWPGKGSRPAASAMLVDGVRRWVTYHDPISDGEDFEQIRRDFMAAHPAGPDTWQAAAVAYGASRLFRIRPLVEFAVSWIAQHRR